MGTAESIMAVMERMDEVVAALLRSYPHKMNPKSESQGVDFEAPFTFFLI
jgi:hypothetical protein